MRAAYGKNVLNSFQQVGPGGVWISYTGQSPVGRSWCWSVNKNHADRLSIEETKHFHLDVMEDARKRNSSPSLARAKAYAENRYGIKHWRRNCLGDWVDANADLPEIRKR